MSPATKLESAAAPVAQAGPIGRFLSKSIVSRTAAGRRFAVIAVIDSLGSGMFYADSDVSGCVEVGALELARRHSVRRIVATQERDLERAAQLREILGLSGQRLQSAAAFRDKGGDEAARAGRRLGRWPWPLSAHALQARAGVPRG
jgi:hypothetical protein